MADHEFLDALPAYAAGSLSGEQKSRLEDHLREGCDLCVPELFLLSEDASRLPYAIPDSPLPPGLKEKVRSRLQKELESSPSPRVMAPARGSWLLRAAALAGFALAALLIGRLMLGNRMQEQRLAERDAQIEKLETDLKSSRQEISWLRDPAVQLALLSGLKLAPGAKARMIWSPVESKGMLYVESLPALTSDKSYQLWIIGDAGPVSGGIFAPDRSGNAVLNIARVSGTPRGNLQFAVTIEPHGGVPQPTGSMVLAGKPI